LLVFQTVKLFRHNKHSDLEKSDNDNVNEKWHKHVCITLTNQTLKLIPTQILTLLLNGMH